MALKLKNLNLDNHFGYNWELVEKQAVVTGNSVLKPEIGFYPNPARDYLHIDKNTTGSLQVRIYTLVGHCVWASELHESGSIDISRIATGVYLIQLGTSTRRLIIRR